MKLGVLAITSLMLATTVATPAFAQRRTCVVDDQTGTVACGRLANQFEINQYNQYYGGSGTRQGSGQNSSNYSDRQAYDAVNRLFRDVLGRDGDFNSIRGYASQLQQGRALSDIRREMAQSSEAAEAIRRIYREVLGREPDPAGFSGYQRALQEGWSLGQIRSEISNSQEAQNRR